MLLLWNKERMKKQPKADNSENPKPPPSQKCWLVINGIIIVYFFVKVNAKIHLWHKEDTAGIFMDTMGNATYVAIE